MVLIFCTSDCASIYHDYDNPCTPGAYHNAVECEKWQQKYPREFSNYRKRNHLDIPKDSIN